MAAKAPAKPARQPVAQAKSGKRSGPVAGSEFGLSHSAGSAAAVAAAAVPPVAAAGAPKSAARVTPPPAATGAQLAAVPLVQPAADGTQAGDTAVAAVKAARVIEDRPCTLKELHIVRQEVARVSKGCNELLAKQSAKLQRLQDDLRHVVDEAVREQLDRLRVLVVEESVAAAVRSVQLQTAAPPASGPAGELEALRRRAERAELELQAARSELELKAVQPELMLRALRAERELQSELERVGVEDLKPSAPARWPSERLIVLDRYEVYRDDVIGQGGFSVVRRGRDLQSGAEVAVKTYWDMEDQQHQPEAWLFDKFRHEIEIFQRLHTQEDLHANILRHKQVPQLQKRSSWFVPDGVSDQLHEKAFSSAPPAADLFVQLLDYSRDANGQPGPRPGDNDVCYAVLELADYTLHQYLEGRQQSGHSLSQNEVAVLFRQLAYMILVLHSKNFVHIDLKPMNIMHFPSGHWKLIDMDGMVWPGIATACDVCYTPYYVAPEISVQFAAGLEEVNTSRLLDVWSLGMCACELVTMCPVLEAKYMQMWHQYENPVPFLEWLADPAVAIEVPTRVRNLDPQLADVISRMLQKSPEHRASMVEVLLHPYFTGQRCGDWASAEQSCAQERGLVRRYVARLAARTSIGLDEAELGDSRGLLPDLAGAHDKRQANQPTLRRKVSILMSQDEPAIELQSMVRGAATGLTGISEWSRSSDGSVPAIPRRSPALPQVMF